EDPPIPTTIQLLEDAEHAIGLALSSIRVGNDDLAVGEHPGDVAVPGHLPLSPCPGDLERLGEQGRHMCRELVPRLIDLAHLRPDEPESEVAPQLVDDRRIA